MSILEFASGSPVLSFLLAWLFCACLFRIWNRGMRAMNIRKNGWPPEHCDADGDFRSEKK